MAAASHECSKALMQALPAVTALGFAMDTPTAVAPWR